MSEKFDQDLDELIGLLRASGVKTCRYNDGKSTLHLEFADISDHSPAQEKPVVPAEQEIEVRSPGIGYVSLQQTGIGTPLCKLNEHVTKGQTIALVTFENLFLSVKAPTSGKVVGLHVKDGQRVGYGDLVATIRP